jgi:hypothetical protein
MNTDQIKGNWNQFIGKVGQRRVTQRVGEAVVRPVKAGFSRRLNTQPAIQKCAHPQPGIRRHALMLQHIMSVGLADVAFGVIEFR